MLQLAIECSGIHGSIAVCEGRPCTASIALPTNKNSVQTLAQAVKSALAGSLPSFISVTSGPGSFTGLRVGLTTVKMLGLAWNLPIVAVDTLQVLAHQIAAQQFVNRQSDSGPIIVVPVINAFRRQVFASVWLAGANGTIVPLTNAQVLDADTWLSNPLAGYHVADSARIQTVASVADPIAEADPARVQSLISDPVPDLARVQTAITEHEPDLTKPLNKLQQHQFVPDPIIAAQGAPTHIAIGGPGLENYLPKLSHCPIKINSVQINSKPDQMVPVKILHGVNPDAMWVANVGFQKFDAGQCESAESLMANYVRASAAEEKLRS
ncbi:MAG: tRNA (adenosine(37)-N6)-threonylcarbamoyltransferase complex dimerization subunit type 1 TsaB [Pirellulales bacterium]